jgi:hypothetical protein
MADPTPLERQLYAALDEAMGWNWLDDEPGSEVPLRVQQHIARVMDAARAAGCDKQLDARR